MLLDCVATAPPPGTGQSCRRGDLVRAEPFRITSQEGHGEFANSTFEPTLRAERRIFHSSSCNGQFTNPPCREEPGARPLISPWIEIQPAGGGMRKLDYAILKAIGRLLRRQGDDILTAPHPPQIGKLLSRLEESEGAGAGDEVRAWVLAHRDEAGPGQAHSRISRMRPAYRRRRWRRRRPSASGSQ